MFEGIIKEVFKEEIKDLRLKKAHLAELLSLLADELYGGVTSISESVSVCSKSYVKCPYTGKTIVKKVEQALWLASTLKTQLVSAGIDITILTELILSKCASCVKERLSGVSNPSPEEIASAVYECAISGLEDFISNNERIKGYLLTILKNYK